LDQFLGIWRRDVRSKEEENGKAELPATSVSHHASSSGARKGGGEGQAVAEDGSLYLL
jgi:hypothetical protein